MQIPPEDKDFFLLLRAGLWQEIPNSIDPVSLNPYINWEHIYLLSYEQTVQGIIADGIGSDFALYLHCNKDTIDKSKLFRILKEGRTHP